MPLYDYYCPECGHVEKDVQNSIEDRESGAPNCVVVGCGDRMLLKLASPSFKIDQSFRERLNANYDKHKERVKAGEAKPNSIDKHRGSIG